MGAHSTLKVTRTKAKQWLMDKIFNISDSELESFMDRELDARLYNCVIVDDDEENDDGVI